MGKPAGFLEIERRTLPKLAVDDRLRVFREFELPLGAGETRGQAARCMDCGVPFCHTGCPLGNLIPDWNDLVYRGRWDEAVEFLHKTNNFPEITGRVCPAPCEASCVLGINAEPVSIKLIERAIASHAFGGGVQPQVPMTRTGNRVAVIGSGPAGLAAAQELARMGHAVTVFERQDRLGGLLRYGIPDFKMEKQILDQRLEQLAGEGVIFQTHTHVGRDVTADGLAAEFDATLVCCGAGTPRDLVVEGRGLAGVHWAMDYLEQQNRRVAGDTIPASEAIWAEGKNVVVIGGGDTGSDCIGTANRQRAKRVHNLELLPRPPDARSRDNPWPAWPVIYRQSTSHEEGCERHFAALTKRLEGENGRVCRLHGVCVDRQNPNGKPFTEIPGGEFTLEADLVLLAMGFTGPAPDIATHLGIELGPRGVIKTGPDYQTTKPGIFAAGDARRGASLVVWAIREGRMAAAAINQYLATNTA